MLALEEKINTKLPDAEDAADAKVTQKEYQKEKYQEKILIDSFLCCAFFFVAFFHLSFFASFA
ncbi:MAG: hypothetical protein EAZ37_12240 [Burkholderiales bacterium]|nr:MAG: hypothetical protein EAZ37_12240 [Burkholderiales bacterium]